MRSSCLKRNVGSVIVDERGNVVSSGYNEVPVGERSCRKRHNMCHRERVKEDFAQQVAKIVTDPTTRDRLLAMVNEQSEDLGRCAAIHAEENAILNVARLGNSVGLGSATLYTTMYPCNLCANKIVQVGLGEVVYLEPYPHQEAKRVRDDAGVE